MTDEERALSAALGDLAGFSSTGSPPVSTLLSRGRRRRRARATFACTATAAGIGVAASLAASGTGAGSGYGGAHPAAVGTAPGSGTTPITLALAAEQTDAESFHFTVISKSTAPKADGGGTRTASGEGAYDPSTRHGYTKSTGGGVTAETIRIGDTCYAQPVAGASWLVERCVESSGSPTLADLTQDPAAALKQLESDGRASYVGRSGTGSGAVDTWKFTITQETQSSASRLVLGYTATGTATVGAADGHVHAIDFTVTLAPNRIEVQGGGHVSITFSEFGVPVDVAAPAIGSVEVGSQ